ncbi:MAG: SGNH/GDSL hydrolase family protein [Alphaproteobacteria bacterium]|nr:SGNH/GDSL hydrolase family protein [Alphaproteobacteria bacterium]
MGWLFRPIVVVGGALVGLLAAEGALRLALPALPSVRALHQDAVATAPAFWGGEDPGTPVRPGDHCARSRSVYATQQARERMEPGGAGEPVELLFVGDSFTEGVQVPPEDAWTAVLAARFVEERGQRVHSVNLAKAGADHCDHLHQLEGPGASLTHADVLILQLFADDLEHHSAIVVDGGLAIDPGRIRTPWLRDLASRSYLANLVWFTWAARQAPDRTRVRSPETDAAFRDHLARIAARAQALDAPLLIFLVGPTGLTDCTADPLEFSRCRWLPGDMDHIAALLDESGLPWVDLRTLWDGEERYVLAEEERLVAEGRMDMAIHPDSAGHRVLADALRPYLDDAVPAR